MAAVAMVHVRRGDRKGFVSVTTCMGWFLLLLDMERLQFLLFMIGARDGARKGKGYPQISQISQNRRRLDENAPKEPRHASPATSWVTEPHSTGKPCTDGTSWRNVVAAARSRRPSEPLGESTRSSREPLHNSNGTSLNRGYCLAGGRVLYSCTYSRLHETALIVTTTRDRRHGMTGDRPQTGYLA